MDPRFRGGDKLGTVMLIAGCLLAAPFLALPAAAQNPQDADRFIKLVQSYD